MQKSTLLEKIVIVALMAGAFYYIFYTDRGRRWLDRMLETAAGTVDELLAMLEEELADAQSEAQAEETLAEMED